MRDKAKQLNIDKSDLYNYPNGRIRNNTGSGDGTPVDESVYGDLHENVNHILKEARVDYNDLPDNVTNGYQLYEALMSLGGKNDMIKSISKVSDETLSVPIKMQVLKIDESLIFKSSFDSTTQMNQIKGSDNVQKPLMIKGSFKVNQRVMLINNGNYISLIGLYDSEILPNLVTTLTNITNQFNNWTKVLSVFVQNGAMVFWNKPANEIPRGWQEVVDWRGRFPVGVNPSDDDFKFLHQEAGEKSHKLTLSESVPHKHSFQTSTGGARSDGGNDFLKNPSNSNPFTSNTGFASEVSGSEAQPHNNLPPYRTVLFIEYIG